MTAGEPRFEGPFACDHGDWAGDHAGALKHTAAHPGHAALTADATMHAGATVATVAPVGWRCPTAEHRPTPHTREAHHIWPQGHGGPTVPGNLVDLCGGCHGDVHVLLDRWLKLGDTTTPVEPGWNRRVVTIARLGFAAIHTSQVQAKPDWAVHDPGGHG